MTSDGLSAPVKFPKDHRILKSRQFRWVLRRGERFFTPNFTFVFRRGATVTQIGLTTSRKVGNARQRNRIRRVIRETFRHHKLTLTEPVWVVVIAKPGAGVLENADVRKEFFSFLRDALSRVARSESRRKRRRKCNPTSSRAAQHS